jgi:hypothetical protein
MANAFDAVLETMNTINTGMVAYDQVMAPKVHREAVKLQNQIKIELDDFTRNLESVSYEQYQGTWEAKRNQITKNIQMQSPAVQNALTEWWDSASTDYQVGVNGAYHQKWKAGELVGLQTEIDQLSEMQNSDMAMSSIRSAIEAAHDDGVIDAQTAYQVSKDAIGKIKYQGAKKKALEMVDSGQWKEAYEYALLGENGLDQQRRAALRSELGQIRSDRDNEIKRLDMVANDEASSLAEQIIDGERPIFQMDALIESDGRMSGQTKLYWRNWMYARQLELEKAEDQQVEQIDDLEREQTKRELLNTVMDRWNENGYQDEQRQILDIMRVNDYITKNEWDDYMGTIKGDPIQDPGYKDGFDWINRNLDPENPETFKIKEAFRRKALENRMIGGQLNKNRWSGQEYVQLAQNLARGEILGKIFKSDQFAFDEFGGRFTLNPVEEEIYKAQRGDYLGLTEESAGGFLQIETHQKEMIEELLGEPVEKVSRNRTGLPEFHWKGRKFMLLIPLDESGKPTEKDEGLFIYMGENQDGGERWDPVNIEELQQDIQNWAVDKALQELKIMHQQLGGTMWPSVARKEIKRVAEKNQLPLSIVTQAAKNIGLVNQEYRNQEMADQINDSMKSMDIFAGGM